MDILNRLGLNVENKTETNKGDRLHYAVAENYKISSIELENIQLKDAINETMKASSEDFKGVVDKVKSGLSNIWEKILEIFKAIRKFFKSIIDKIFRRKIKKDIDKSKEVINTILSGKAATSTKSTPNTNVKTESQKDTKTSKTPLLLEEPEYRKKDNVDIYINIYYWDNHTEVAKIINDFSVNVNDYYDILMDKTNKDAGLIPGIAEYLNSGSTDSDVFFFLYKPKHVERKVSSFVKRIEEIGEKLDSNKDNFKKVTTTKFNLKFIKDHTDLIGRLFEDIDKKYRVIDKEIGGIIKRVERMVKSKKKNVTDKNKETVSKILEVTKILQGIISEGTKTTLKTLYNIALLTRLSIASENNDRSYITK